jgi:hypothetical protein
LLEEVGGGVGGGGGVERDLVVFNSGYHDPGLLQVDFLDPLLKQRDLVSPPPPTHPPTQTPHTSCITDL